MKTIKLQGFEEIENGIHYEYDADSTPLGEGAMGRVYKGVCVNHKTQKRTAVAIKAIFDYIPESVVERARREAAIRVDSPYLLRMLGFIEQTITVNSNGHAADLVRYFVIMELLEGVTLYDMMQGNITDASGNDFPAVKKLYDSYIIDKDTTIQTIISKTLRGVKALHNEGYIHRDIDPTNIMITSDGHIKLIDFGICKKINTLGTSDKNLTATGLFMGKVNYASPELIIGDVKHQNQSTDIYALGVLLYQLCSGHLPFSGSDNEVLLAHMRKKVPMKDLKGCPFKKIILKATQKIQAARYNSAEQMLADVDSVDFSQKNYMKIILLIASGICVFVVGCIVWYCSSHNTTDKIASDSIQQHQIVIEDTFRNLQKRLWSKDKKEVMNAFDELSSLAYEEQNTEAMFEYGLSFSVGNETLDMPTKRQNILNIDVDIEKANYWLRRVLEKEPDNYRAIYWILNNLITKRQRDEKSVVMSEIDDLLEKFDEYTESQDDRVVNIYKNAVEEKRSIIKEWHR